MNLSSLSEGFRELNSLEVLNLSSCAKLDALPERFGKLNLTNIDFGLCQKLDVALIFDVIFKFEGLTKLSLMAFEMVTLPERFGELSNLQTLNLQYCRALVSLPERFGQLENLRTLNLESCRSLGSLPEGFGELKSLTSLDLQECRSLVSLSEGFGDLKNLHTLSLACCTSLGSLSEGFGDLTNLATLYLDGAPAGRSMPAALKAQLEAQGCESSGNGW